MQFRIGINLGDVIVEGDDIHGDGVNITARLQQLADQGGIAISGMAYDHVVHKIDVGFEFLGEQRVKSLSEPVRVYRVRMDVATVRAKELRPARRWVVPAGAAVVLVLVAGVVAALWPWATSQRLPGAGLPADKPSIAVLPFDNLSGDADQAYFAEGLTDDLITDLSKISGLFVIARNSTWGYDPTVDVREWRSSWTSAMYFRAAFAALAIRSASTRS